MLNIATSHPCVNVSAVSILRWWCLWLLVCVVAIVDGVGEYVGWWWVSSHPFLFTLFTNDCVSGNQSVHVVKFSDDTTVIGCVNNVNESVYREKFKDWLAGVRTTTWY